MKTFKDLEFKEHQLAKFYKGAKQAIMEFENGFGVSVIFGSCFYSNGIDTYEVAVLKNGSLCYDTIITSDVLGGLTESEVSEVIQKVQNL